MTSEVQWRQSPPLHFHSTFTYLCSRREFEPGVKFAREDHTSNWLGTDVSDRTELWYNSSFLNTLFDFYCRLSNPIPRHSVGLLPPSCCLLFGGHDGWSLLNCAVRRSRFLPLWFQMEWEWHKRDTGEPPSLAAAAALCCLYWESHQIMPDGDSGPTRMWHCSAEKVFWPQNALSLWKLSLCYMLQLSFCGSTNSCMHCSRECFFLRCVLLKMNFRIKTFEVV